MSVQRVVVVLLAVSLAACSLSIGPAPRNWKASDGPPKCDQSETLPFLDGAVGYPLLIGGGLFSVLALAIGIDVDTDSEPDPLRVLEPDDYYTLAAYSAALAGFGTLLVLASRRGSARSHKCRELQREYAQWQRSHPNEAHQPPRDQTPVNFPEFSGGSRN